MELHYLFMNDECSYTYLFYIQTSHTICKYVLYDDEHKAAGFRLNSILSLAAVSIVSYCGTTTTTEELASTMSMRS